MKKVRKLQSSIIAGTLSALTESEKRRTQNRMALADRLAELIRLRGFTQKSFARKLNKTESEVSEWLSGNRNFTIDTLSDIGEALGVRFFDLPKRIKMITGEPSTVKLSPSRQQITYPSHYSYLPVSPVDDTHSGSELTTITM